MELVTWSPDFGLPSWHPPSLAMRAYAKFTGAPLNVQHSDNPLFAAVPLFRHRDVATSDFDAFVRHLADECRISADAGLSPRLRSDAVAFKRLVEATLRPAFAFAAWVDGKNQTELTRPWFARRMPFPLGLFYPGRYQRAAKRLAMSAVEDAVGDADDEAVAERFLYRGAEAALASLSDRLGDEAFLLGATPSSLDALVFSYLAPLMRVPFPSARLAEAARAHANLERYVARILATYFPDLPSASSVSFGKTKEEDEEAKSAKASRRSAQWNGLFAAVMAAAAMAGYAHYSGLYHVVRNSRQTRAVQHFEDNDGEEE